MRRPLLAATLTAVLAVGVAAAGPSQATPLPQGSTCSGVWVVVDYGSLGGTGTRCATSYSSGTKALRSAGFSLVIDGGFILRINSKPSAPDINTEYWSYWHATRADDGTYSDWNYSSLGADSYQPTKGNAEGWRYQKLSDGKVSPSVSPPVATVTTPTAKATTKTTKKATAKATTSTTTTASGTATATATASKKKPKKTATPTPTASASATASATAASTQAAPLESDQLTEPGTAPASGSPVGAIVAGLAVVGAGAGLGIWWLRKGRRP